jgi:protein TonB
VSDKRFLVYLSAFIVSAILVCGTALLLPLTITGRGLAKSGVELSETTNLAHFSTYAKSAGPTAWPRIGPESASLQATGPDPIGSISGPPPIPRPATDPPSAGLGSPTLEKVQTISLTEPLSGRPEGTTESVEQTVGPERPTLEQAELTPQGAATVQGQPTSEETSPRSRHAETASQLVDTPHLKPVALGPRNRPLVSATKAPLRSADASTYAERVWSRLARHKPRAVQRGSTTVAFEIVASGALRYVRVSQSSGDPQLDQMALQTVSNAAPFLPPPNGTSSFTVQIDF